MKPLKVSSKTIRKIKAWNRLTEKTSQHFPYVRVKDVRSPGRRYEHFCLKQKRIVHLLSDGEFRTYLKLIWNPLVVRVNEQVPLDLKETMQIAEEQQITHPRDYKKNHAHVMTTDFVVSEIEPNTGELIDTAYSFKYFKSIYKIIGGESIKSRKRTWQKLDLEKAYWEKRNIKYVILTEMFAQKNEIYNIQLFLTEHHKSVDKYLLLSFIEKFIEHWNENPLSHLEQLLLDVSKELDINRKYAFTLFKKATLQHLLALELTEKKVALNRKVYLV
ncbi:TnsA endonuclease N-terminal domain-containing protein [Cellvibrio mixtus]|nr:TnsA endonuclease N-terminal domain-containing protein [Cellvibrio mixtus]